MRRVAPEFDSLIWTLVEEGNERAIDEFLARHPEFKQEVARRSLMVKGLKEMKPETERPPFRPAERIQYQGPTRMVYVAAGLVLAALGVASFTVTYLTLPKPAEPAKIVAPPARNDPSKFTEDAPQLKPRVPTSGQLGPEDEPPVTTQAPKPTPPKRIAIKIEDAPLHTVFDLISAESGMQVIVAPGTPNPAVGVNYADMTTMEILKDMGREHGFTPMDQGDGSIIIIPAVEGPDSLRPVPAKTGSEPKSQRTIHQQ